MYMYLVLVVVLSCSALLWLGAVRLWLMDEYLLLESLHESETFDVPPFLQEDEASPRFETWQSALHTLKGVARMSRNASALLGLSKRQVDHTDLAAVEEYRQLRGRCLLLRFCLLGCVFEAIVRAIFAGMPRFYPRLAATLYGEMCTGVHCLLEVYRPELLDKARLVL